MATPARETFAPGSGRDVIRIDGLGDARVDDFRNVRDAELWRERDAFVVEGRTNVLQLLEFGRFAPRALLLSDTAFAAMEPALARLAPPCAVYVAAAEVLDGVVGFPMHRGCLAVAERGEALTVEQATRDARTVVVVEDLTDTDNVGAIFRNALALGADALVLSPRCCDPALPQGGARLDGCGVAVAIRACRVLARSAGRTARARLRGRGARPR